ncbi:MAG: hypothetical protein H7Y27_13760 [Gemmatimonadaceae bacterium]|nr:hypothetical protein [Chitinophagaceae bacterium]
MPVILSEEEAKEWMMGDLGEKEILHLASTQCERTHMKAYPIAKDFKTAADPREPAAYENLPELVL